MKNKIIDVIAYAVEEYVIEGEEEYDGYFYEGIEVNSNGEIEELEIYPTGLKTVVMIMAMIEKFARVKTECVDYDFVDQVSNIKVKTSLKKGVYIPKVLSEDKRKEMTGWREKMEKELWVCE